MESDLTAVLKTLCPRVYPDFAPAGTQPPWVTYQAIGGRALRWLDGTAADKRHTLLQVNAYSNTRAATLALIRSIEDALRASTAINAQPAAEPYSTIDADLTPPLYGSHQDFDIYSQR